MSHGVEASRRAAASPVQVAEPVGQVEEVVAVLQTADTALRLARYFGPSAEIWLDLQSDYDLRTLRRTAGDAIEAQVRVRAA
jgi:addiction module HigA family antidote